MRPMKALMLTEYKSFEIQDVPTPEIAPNEVLIRVEACGICGSDVHGYDGSSGRRIPPLIMGHEASGIIAAIGDQVTGWKEGQKVTFDSTVSCGNCYFCLRGSINLCDNRRVLGVSCGEYRQHGAFAEYVAVPQHILYSVPDDVPFEHAAMVEAVSVAVHAANRTPIRLGDSCVVVGSGMIGLLVIQAMKAAGCDQVIAVDLSDEKLELAVQLGATSTFNPKSCDVPEEIRRLTGGRGADIAMEVVGATPTIATAIESVRKGGTVTLVGNLAPKIELPLQAVVTRELNVLGTCASSGEYPECIALMKSGAIQVEPLISARATLQEAPELFDRLYAAEPGLMKVIVTPQA